MPNTAIISADSSLTAGIDFPANIDVTCCICGGGGGGGAYLHDNGDAINAADGGNNGNPASSTINIPDGTVVDAIVGIGGYSVGHGGYGAGGGQGGDSSFGSYASALGGIGGQVEACSDPDKLYHGVGAETTTCLGTNLDGTGLTTSGGDCGKGAYGGQSSGYSKGGNHGLDSQAENGGIGSGGGGSMNASPNIYSGAGGHGIIILTW